MILPLWSGKIKIACEQLGLREFSIPGSHRYRDPHNRLVWLASTLLHQAKLITGSRLARSLQLNATRVVCGSLALNGLVIPDDFICKALRKLTFEIDSDE